MLTLFLKITPATPWASSACLRHLLKEPKIGKFIVPIIPDEARTEELGLNAEAIDPAFA